MYYRYTQVLIQEGSRSQNCVLWSLEEILHIPGGERKGEKEKIVLRAEVGTVVSG